MPAITYDINPLVQREPVVLITLSKDSATYFTLNSVTDNVDTRPTNGVSKARLTPNDRNSPGRKHVHVVLLPQYIDLLSRNTSEREHSFLQRRHIVNVPV